MWWKTTIVALGAIFVVIVITTVLSLLIPGDGTGPFLVRNALAFIVGLSLGRIAFVTWDAWTADDRGW